MFKIHLYVDGVPFTKRRLPHIPSCGDTVRLSEDRYAKTTEIIWCFDEESPEGQRVNIRAVEIGVDDE